MANENNPCWQLHHQEVNKRGYRRRREDDLQIPTCGRIAPLIASSGGRNFPELTIKNWHVFDRNGTHRNALAMVN